MSQRNRILVTVEIPVEPMPHPNRHVPKVTVEVRAAWPPNSGWSAVHGALEEAVRRAGAQVWEKFKEAGDV